MAQRIDRLKDSLVGRAAALIRERLGPEDGAAAVRLLEAYYEHVPPEDILKREPEAISGAVVSLFAFIRQRQPGTAKLRVYHPTADDGGWDSPHSIVEMVNDDMPFLVDSVTAALEREELNVHLIVHPMLAIERDGAGRLLTLGASGDRAAPPESLIHIEIDRQSAEAARALARRLEEVLAEVRAAVGDWKAMRERVRSILNELEEAPASVDQMDLGDAGDLLRWLHDDRFTFLGTLSLTFGSDDAAPVTIDAGSALGILRNPALPIFDERRDLAATTRSALDILRRPQPLLLFKADRLARVHRAVPMDIIIVKRYRPSGEVTGWHAIVGLMGAAVYTQSPLNMPLIRRRVEKVVARAGFRPASHDARALETVIEGYPRDELLQADDEHLFATAIGILRLQERRRVAVFLRRDEFARFVSVLVFVPRDRYDTRLRLQIQAIIEQAVDGTITTRHTQVADSPLARLHFIVRTPRGESAQVDVAELEARIAEAARSWLDRLHEVLVEEMGEERGLALYRRWGSSFPASYTEAASPRIAVFDIERMEAAADGAALHLYQPAESSESDARFKIYNRTSPVPLSDVLPLFEHMGFRVLAEEPYHLKPAGAEAVWIHNFALTTADGSAIEVEGLRGRFEEAFRAVWKGEAEDDGFNRLVVNAGLSWRQVVVLRSYSKYLRQAGSTFTQTYVVRSVVANPRPAALLVRLFEARFDPASKDDADAAAGAFDEALEAVLGADEDRILRRFRNLVDSTLRTNAFQPDAEGRPKPYLSIKLDSRQVQGLPLPRPMVEVFVYSPRVEGIHLRGGKVARGGIRWSDRPEDFRTEILGLMKAQMVKNAVIVPVGSKGGFVVKRSPRTGGREALAAEAVECYRTLMRGLLDLTDNLASGGRVVAPPHIVRRDGDDPYLVVAADKGTATFSDIANGVAADYGYWLGDAFASGGSHGYDHKAMGITARGAWESVKRHFREMGRDVQADDFTVVGVGDMSGDVFGNGMLRSPRIKLLAAFDHRHIFLDPDPDPESSFAERARLFALPRSSWADYDPSRLSRGGAVIPRESKLAHLSPEVRERFGIAAAALPPADLIRALLAAPVDLLWFGGIGTFVKASGESSADAGDRTNDALRVNAGELRCKVVGEGANLAVTQRGRIEYAQGGGRINTDAIDNSAGVDTSDHEVNIKILLDAAVASGDLTTKQRNNLLMAMTDEVGILVLRHNYLQTEAISMFEAQAPTLLDQEERFIRLLERSGRLDRAVEFLPDDEEMTRRRHARLGLTRPELAILLAYGKMWLFDLILESDLPDDPVLNDDLVGYFPRELASQAWRERMAGHRLRREIVATVLANAVADRVGGSFVARIMERTGTPPADIVRAWVVVRDSFELDGLWAEIQALDGKVPAAAQNAMRIEIGALIERGVNWVLGHCRRPLDIGALGGELAPGIAAVRERIEQALPGEIATALESRAEALRVHGVPGDLARRIAILPALASANDISRIAMRANQPPDAVGHLYFLIESRFGFGWLRAAAAELTGGGHWQALAADALMDDLYARHANLTAAVAETAAASPDEALARWSDNRQAAVARADQLLGELRAAGKLDLATLVVASRQLRGLTDG